MRRGLFVLPGEHREQVFRLPVVLQGDAHTRAGVACRAAAYGVDDQEHGPLRLGSEHGVHLFRRTQFGNAEVGEFGPHPGGVRAHSKSELHRSYG